MKRQWTIKRHLKETPDGQSRWNQAYQLLLKAVEPIEEGAAGTVPVPYLTMAQQETRHENRTLCPCFDATTSSEPND
jgi:hypothetical protein